MAAMDVIAPIFFASKLHPRRPALMWIGGGISYAHLAQSILTTARALRAAGVTRRDIAGIDIKVAHHHCVVLLALMHLGIPTVSIELSTREPAQAAGVNIVIADSGAPKVSARHIVLSEQWFSGEGEEAALADIGFGSDDDLFSIKFTSGTTGRPLPMRVHVGEVPSWLQEHRYFPMHGRTMSMFGLSSGVGSHALIYTLSNGGTFCVAGNSQEAFDTIQLCGVETLLASTMQLRRIAERAREAREPLHSLKSALVGGASVSAALIALAQRYLCNDIIVHYASSQAGFVAIAPAAMLEGRPGAVGFVMPAAQVECVDDNNEPVAPGGLGELRIRTLRTRQRENQPGNAAALGFRDGWFYSGDIGRIEPDGMLILAGRKSELVNIGGEKVAPDLVDETLLSLPGVRDAAAFGCKGSNGEEELWAAVVTDMPPDIPALISACRRQLAGCAPSVILRAGAIPRNAAGKVMRAKLTREVEAIASRAGASEQS